MLSYHPLPSADVSRSLSIAGKLRLRRYPPFLNIRAAQQIPNPPSTGLQRKTDQVLSRILITEAAIKAIEEKAESKKYNNLWPKAVLEALDEAIRDNRWNSALKIFGLLRQQKWYEPRSTLYAKLLMMLGKCRQPEEAKLLFKLMRADRLRPSLDVYTALISAYGQSGQLDKALATLDGMKSDSDCKPDVYTYSILISCCVKCRQFELIGMIMDEMSYYGIECTTVTYNIIVDGYGKTKMFKEMENVLTDMVESGSSIPDIFTCNSVIGAYGNSGKIDKMEKWYDEFQLMGIKPDIKTFNILIKSYGKKGLYEKMGSVLEYMKKRFFTPTIVTHNIIIDAFGKAGDIEKMDEYFKKMKHQGIKPNTITYCSLVSAYSKAGLLMKVDSVLRQVENSDVVLDTPFFNCIISAYGRGGDIEKMDQMFLAMKERKCEPDSITFATMIHFYNVQGMTEAAQELETEMIAAEDNLGIL
ncbi:hypothetical protein Tsubulata_020931 [Turnera subulata]|uniref:Pentacotripeptide-repeat region of PRORP domain-containing protein n=1 Tax=Turnera subulata TaxID=218843 RepID=A0A9Q0G4L1_9ROSI|nr:hypothetical protein Tsubulata_020931 [Turnera subulata]